MGEEVKLDGCPRECGSKALKHVIEYITLVRCAVTCGGTAMNRNDEDCAECTFYRLLTRLERELKEAEKA